MHGPRLKCRPLQANPCRINKPPAHIINCLDLVSPSKRIDTLRFTPNNFCNRMRINQKFLHQRAFATLLLRKKTFTQEKVDKKNTLHQKPATPEAIWTQTFYTNNFYSWYTMGIVHQRAFHQKTLDCKARPWIVKRNKSTWPWGCWSSMYIILLLLVVAVIYGTRSLKEPFAARSGKVTRSSSRSSNHVVCNFLGTVIPTLKNVANV